MPLGLGVLWAGSRAAASSEQWQEILAATPRLRRPRDGGDDRAGLGSADSCDRSRIGAFAALANCDASDCGLALSVCSASKACSVCGPNCAVVPPCPVACTGEVTRWPTRTAHPDFAGRAQPTARTAGPIGPARRSPTTLCCHSDCREAKGLLVFDPLTENDMRRLLERQRWAAARLPGTRCKTNDASLGRGISIGKISGFA